MSAAKSTSPVCSECAYVKRTNRYSCCTFGGAWFRNCGPNFDHSWADGIKACEGSTDAVVAQGRVHGVHKIVDDQKQNTASEVEIAGSKRYDEVSKIFLTGLLSLIMLHTYA